MVLTCVAKHFGPRHHTLPELFRKSCQRLFVHAERPKSLPSKSNGYPSLLAFNRLPRLLNGRDLTENSCKPRTARSSVAECEELISARERRHAGYDDMLEIIEIKTAISARLLP